MARIARLVVVSGRVTGVGFRYATVLAVRRYPVLTGYVRNADRTTVECLLQGDADDVEAMVTWLRRGPPGARVLEQTVSAVPWQEDLTSFDIVG